MSLKITELKVAELRAELEKRGLDKSGVKTALIERLRNALKDEGIDADEYEFKNKTELANSETGEEEEMDTLENSKETSKDDEDIPCSDDEELDDYKHKEDTESARFKTAQSRSDAPVIIDLDASNGPEPDSETKEGNVSETEPCKETQNGSESAEAPDSNDSKAGKNKVLKVIGKDKVQQFAVTARTLWVTGLASTSKVSDLKNFFSKHGKVTSVKIVRSTKGTQRKWYGLLTMATSKDASKCIEKLHRTEFGGHVISVERRQTAPIVKKSEAATVKKTSLKGDSKDSAGKSEKESKKSEDEKRKDSQDDSDEKDKSDDDDRGSPDRHHRSYESRSYFRGRRPFRRPMGGYRGRGMSFRGRGGRYMGFRRPFGRTSHFERSSFRPYSSRGRYRGYEYDDGRSGRGYPSEREMRMKQEEEMYRHKIIIRKQKEESYRLEREKNQLRIEREMLEREKAEMLKLERAKQRMEREQLELEREKLRRQAQMSHPMKRPFSSRGGGPPNWAEKRRESEMDGPSQSFHRKKFAPDSKFPYPREHSTYKKPEFMHHEEFRREKMEMPPHAKFGERDERREVTYHGGQERRVYSRGDFRGPGPSSSPPMKHYAPRNKPREDWKFHERRSNEKPGYAPRGRKMGFYQ